MFRKETILVFSPALFAVYFFGPEKGAPKNVFMIVSASGTSEPEIPFIGIVNDPSTPKQKVYDSLSRYAFTYLSSTKNPMKYWIDMNGDAQNGVAEIVASEQSRLGRHERGAVRRPFLVELHGSCCFRTRIGPRVAPKIPQSFPFRHRIRLSCRSLEMNQ